MRFLASAECPSCKWKMRLPIDTEGSLEESIKLANEIVDPMLTNHIKEHEAIAAFLQEAGAIPDKTINNFRGSFNLRYQEVLDGEKENDNDKEE